MSDASPERRTSLLVARALANIPLVGAAVRGVCDEYLGSPESSGMVEVALVEACVNAMRHGAHERHHEPLRVDLLVATDRLEFVLVEEGTSYDFAGAEMPEVDETPLEALPESGFGIPLIKSIMDEAEYRRMGDLNVLRLVKRRPSGCGDAA